MGRACPFVGSPRWTVSPSFPRSAWERTPGRSASRLGRSPRRRASGIAFPRGAWERGIDPLPRSVPQRADAGHEPEHEVIPGHLRMPGMYHLVIHRKCQSSAVIVIDEFDEFPLVVALDVGRLTLR